MSQAKILLAFESNTQHPKFAPFGHFELCEAHGLHEISRCLGANPYACCVYFGTTEHLYDVRAQAANAALVWVTNSDKAGSREQRPAGVAATWHENEVTGDLLAFCLPLVIERERLRQRFEEQWSKKAGSGELEREITALLSWYYRTTVTAESFGLKSIKDLSPERFAGFVETFDNLISQALSRTEFEILPEASIRLRELSHELGLLNAGPRDVIDIYAAAIRHRSTRKRGSKQFDVGRLMLLELMGYMVTYYRNIAMIALDSRGHGTADARGGPE